MSKLIREARAGTDDRGDTIIKLGPAEDGSGISVTIKSKVEALFYEQIETSVKEILLEYGIEDAVVDVNDKSALDYVIRARTEAAILRATGQEGADPELDPENTPKGKIKGNSEE